MTMRSGSKASLFLLEMIIVILFFALASGISVRIFVQAHLISNESVMLSQSVFQASNAAESIKSTEGSMEAVAELLGGQVIEGNKCLVYYDANWQVTAKPVAGGAQMQLVTSQASSGILTSDICLTAQDTQKTLYQLTVREYPLVYNDQGKE